MNILHALVEGRKKRGISQKGMAELIGIKQSTLARYEAEEGPMPLWVAERYAEMNKGKLIYLSPGEGI
jgi:transcriptional regulator with XRE-family HTH domain